jgi:hypothetical protein
MYQDLRVLSQKTLGVWPSGTNVMLFSEDGGKMFFQNIHAYLQITHCHNPVGGSLCIMCCL